MNELRVSFKFFNVLFSLFVLLNVFVFKMLLVGIDSQFFAFDKYEYIGPIFLSVWVSKYYRNGIRVI